MMSLSLPEVVLMSFIGTKAGGQSGNNRISGRHKQEYLRRQARALELAAIHCRLFCIELFPVVSILRFLKKYIYNYFTSVKCLLHSIRLCLIYYLPCHKHKGIHPPY